ncbi:MAG: ribosome maturation factor RimM, partial [Bacilli bacterium]|nr:ribosome maturation factor RimM [Bacilli bacterium]
VNTHGIKGEIRITSDFELKDKVFKIGHTVIINNQEFIIKSYRVHKNFDMITLQGFDDINQVLPFKGLNLYVKRSSLDLEEDDYLMEDLIGMTVMINGENYGIVKDYNCGQNSLLHINYQNKTYYIPLKGTFILSVDTQKREILASNSVKELVL